MIVSALAQENNNDVHYNVDDCTVGATEHGLGIYFKRAMSKTEFGDGCGGVGRRAACQTQ